MTEDMFKLLLDKKRYPLHKVSRTILAWRNKVMLKRGFLVAFEGIDGAGKTSQANLLFNHLRNFGFDAVLTKEPTDSIYGQKIKKLAQSGRETIPPHEEYNLFINDRKIHVTNLLKPSLEEKKIVILDRYYFSNVAYQGAIGLDPSQIKKDNEAFSPIPEIVFLLQVPPRVGIRRIQKSRKETPNLFEQEEYLTAVAKVFDSLDDNYIVRINGVDEPEVIHRKIRNVIDDVIDHYMKKQEQFQLFESITKAM